MADQKISQLNNITGANVDDSTDELAIVDASANETKAITRGELFKSVSFADFDNGEIHGANIVGDFRTRAEAISNLSNIPTGAYFWIGDLLFRKVASSSVIPDMPNVEPASTFLAMVDHFVASTSEADRHAGAVAAFNWLNASDFRKLLAHDEIWITGTLPTITGEGKSFDFSNVDFFVRPSATTGAIFVFGATGTDLKYSKFKLGTMRHQGTADPDDFLFDYVNTNDVHVEIGEALNFASLCRIGGTTTDANRAAFKGNRASLSKGGSAESNVLIQRGANIDFQCYAIFSGGVACNANANGAIIRLKGVSGAALDTIRIRNTSAQMFSVGADGDHAEGSIAVDGKPYGLVLDGTGGRMPINVHTEGFCVFDHTTTAGLYVVDDGTTGNGSRYNQLNDLHIVTDDGVAVKFEKGSAASLPWNFTLNGLALGGSDSANIVEISGDGYSACALTNSKISQTNQSVTAAAGIDIASNSWSFTGNMFGRFGSTSSAIATAFNIDAGVSDILIEGNYVAPDILTEITEPAYTDPRNTNRHIYPVRERRMPTAVDVADAYVEGFPSKRSQLYVESLAAPSIVTGNGSHFFDDAGTRQWHPTALARAGATVRVYDFTDSTRLWADASRSTAITDGTGIYTADEIWGQSSNLVQVTSGSRPTWTDAATDYALFDGTDDHMAVSVSQSQAFTVAISCQATNIAASGPFLLGNNSGDYIRFLTTGAVQAFFGTPLNSTTGLVSDNSDYRVIATINGASSEVWLNNSSIATGAAGANTISTLVIGNRITSGGVFLAGRIYRVALISGALSAADRGYLDTWLTP